MVGCCARSCWRWSELLAGRELMRILVTNDDGYLAGGIQTLARRRGAG
jgi:hypothetical protein